MSADAQLVSRQAALVRALIHGGPVPLGFDEGRVRAVAQSLVMKRLRSVRRVWPGLAYGLGEAFDRLFVAYATGRPMPHKGGAIADGDAFVAHLLATGHCPDEVRRERLIVALEYRRTAAGLVRRSRWSVVVRWTIAGSPRRVTFGLRLFRRTILW